MANPVPTVFRPVHVVRIALRLDEYDDTGALRARLPNLAPGASPVATPEQPSTVASPPLDAATQDQLLDQIGSLDDQIEAVYAADPGDTQGAKPLQVQRDGLIARLGGTATAPSTEATSGDAQAPDYIGGPPPDDRHLTLLMLPITSSIERNGLRTADGASFVVNYRDLPTDARLVRGANIELYVGAVDPDDYERGMRGERRGSVDGETRPFSWIQPFEMGRALDTSPTGQSQNVTRFVGIVDTWKTSYDGEDGEVVEVECLDFSSLMMNTPLATGTNIDLTLPIDRGIQAFIDAYPTTRGIKVLYGRPGEASTNIPVPGNAAPHTTRPRRGRGARQGRSGDQQMSMWDHVTDVCGRVGLIPCFYDYTLRILNPRTFWSNTETPRRMVYGRNLEHLEVTRKLGGIRVPTVEIRCYDPDLGRTRWARYPVPDGATAEQSAGIFGVNDPPTAPTRANETSVSGHAPDERIMTLFVQGVTDPQVLRDIAAASFEQMGRQEIEGNFETSFARSVSPNTTRRGGEAPKSVSDDALDCLQLTAGDAVEILVAGGPDIPADARAGLSAVEIQAMSVERRTQYLVNLGWSERVARIFAEAGEATAFQTVFRTQNVRIEMDNDEGLKLVVDYINFITVREEAQTRTDAGVQGEVSVSTVDLTPLQGVLGAADVGTLADRRSRVTRLRDDGVIDDSQYQRDMDALDSEAEVAVSTGGIADGVPS